MDSLSKHALELKQMFTDRFEVKGNCHSYLNDTKVIGKWNAKLDGNEISVYIFQIPNTTKFVYNNKLFKDKTRLLEEVVKDIKS